LSEQRLYILYREPKTIDEIFYYAPLIGARYHIFFIIRDTCAVDFFIEHAASN
jgi:hypothetical protein